MDAKVFAIASDQGFIGSGVTNARKALLGAVFKAHDPSHCFVANEYIANNIGRFFGLPIPPGALTRNADGLGFASLNFNLTGESLPPIDASDCCKKMLDQCTGIVMFDILIANPDRHSENVCAILREPPYKMIAFDHGHALLGYKKSNGIKRLTDLKDRMGITGGSVTLQNRHCLIDEISDSAFIDKWVKVVETMPDHFVGSTCDLVRDEGLIDFSECAAVKDFLKYRRDNLKKLVFDNEREFSGIEQWGLFL